MKSNHVVIWIDHKEAHINYFDSSKNELIKNSSIHTHLHHKASEIGSGNAPEDHHFFHKIIATVADIKEILIIGPGSAKGELLKHAATHDPIVAKQIIGIETVDHPTDAQITAFAKTYFKRVDKLKSNLP